LKNLGVYFSEKDLEPKITESVLQTKNYKFKQRLEEEDELLEMIDHPTMRSTIQRKNVNNQAIGRNKKLTQLLKNWYFDQPRKLSSSQEYINWYTLIDPTLHSQRKGRRSSFDHYRDSTIENIYFKKKKWNLKEFVLQSVIEQEKLRIKEEQRKLEEEKARVIQERQENQRKVEEEHE